MPKTQSTAIRLTLLRESIVRFAVCGFVATVVAMGCFGSCEQMAVGGEYNSVLSIGDDAPAFEGLIGVDDKKYSLKDVKQDVVIIVFTCNSCPYAVDVEDRMIQMVKDYSKKNVALFAINVNKVVGDRFEDMKKRAKTKGFNYPYLFDETQKIAKAYGASRTPEFFVLNSKRKIVYMGALDDSPEGKDVKKTYLLDAVNHLLEMKDPKSLKVKETIAIGCSVRFERKRRQRPTKNKK